MKTAILSDVHSNLEALNACVSHAVADGASRFVCLGDSIGYGPDPADTVARLMSLPRLVAVRGNHDQALDEPSATMPADIRRVIEWTRGQLTAPQRRFLTELPYVARDDGALYVHASAHSPESWEYVETPEQAADCLAAADRPLVFIGHVHVPRVYYETPEGQLRELVPEPGVAIPISRAMRYVVNVGSVGQPRDGIPAACYCLFDSDSRELRFARVPYDHGSTARKLLAAGLPAAFARRLALGR